MPSIPLGPWPLGADNAHDPSHRVFQPPGQGQSFARLTQAVDVVLDDEGWVKTRPGRAVDTELEDATRLHSVAGLLLAQVDTDLVRLVPGDVNPVRVLATGLAPNSLQCIEHAVDVYWTDGVIGGRVTPAGAALPWTLPVAPTPTVTTPAGALPAGRYLVNFVWVDVTGAESGCAESSVLVLDGTKQISITQPAVPAAAAAVRVYCSRANEPTLVLVSTVAVDAFPHVIASAPTGRVPLRVQGLDPMPLGDGLASCWGYLVTWDGPLMWFSQGVASHLCDLGANLFMFPQDILAVAWSDSGLYVATAGGMYYIAGRELTKASVRSKRDWRKYARGSATLEPTLFPGLQLAGPVAAFASEEGLVLCPGDGQVLAPMGDRQRWDVDGKRATFAPWADGGSHYLIVGLEG